MTDTKTLPPATAAGGADRGGSLFHVPLPTHLLYRQYSAEWDGGAPLTAEENEQLAAWRAEEEEAEQRRDILGLVDLATAMEEGIDPPRMLIPDRLVEAEHHLYYGRKETTKTWFGLHDAATLIRRGETVVWADKEMGKRNIAERLIALGCEPEEVGERFVYLEHPRLDLSGDSVFLWKALIEMKRPAAAYFDAQTEFLAESGLNENSGTDLERWSQAYITPLRKLGVATVMFDHTGHSEQGRAVGSRQKGAAAKVELSFECETKPGRNRMGRTTITTTKNTCDADLPRKQAYGLGGDGEGRFIVERADPAADPKAAKDAERRIRIKADIVEQLGAAEGPLNTRQVWGLVKGKNEEISGALDELAKDEHSQVRAEPSGRSLLYSIDPRAAAD